MGGEINNGRKHILTFYGSNSCYRIRRIHLSDGSNKQKVYEGGRKMNSKMFYGMYGALYLIIMFLVFENAKSFIQAAIVMILVMFIAEVDHRYGYYKGNKKSK